MKTPTFLTRYYTGGDDPFLSLNQLPFEKAEAVKQAHCKRNRISGYYAENAYLPHRLKVEAWIRSELLRKGGTPKTAAPVYMALGVSPQGEFDIRSDVQRNACEFRIDIADLNLLSVSFTYPDSLVEFIYDDQFNRIDARFTETPNVYLYGELDGVINRYKVYEPPYQHYIEAQVWDVDTLHRIYRESQKTK